MGTVSLHAIGIDELRDAFSGTQPAVDRLRALAREVWPPESIPARRGGLLAKLGPFSRHAVGAPVVRPGVPTAQDVDDVAQGRDVPPDRREAAWALVDAFVDATAWGVLRFDSDDRTIDDLDFALASAGLPSRFGLRQLFNSATRLPIKWLPGMAGGLRARGPGRGDGVRVGGGAARRRARGGPPRRPGRGLARWLPRLGLGRRRGRTSRARPRRVVPLLNRGYRRAPMIPSAK